MQAQDKASSRSASPPWGTIARALCVMVLLTSPARSHEPPTGPGPSTTATLIIDYGDGFQKRFLQVPCPEEATVWDALLFGMQHPRGVKVERRGSGATLLVTGIDGLLNGSAGDKNWIFRVNDQLGERSAGISPISPGDTILWSFEAYR